MDKAMKLFVFIIFFISIYSCASKKESLNIKNHSINSSHKQQEKKFSKKIFIPPPPLVVSDTLKKIDPLEKTNITLTANNSTLKDVLYIIAQDLGMNLVISPEVDKNQTITATFNQTPAKTVLSVIEDLADVYFEVKDNVLYVKEYQTKTFKLPYIHTNSSYNANLGGDVLGGGTGFGGTTVGGTGSGSTVSIGAGNLQGNFQLNFESPTDVNNFYEQVEKNLKELLSKNGKFSLNKFTGVLIVTDKRKNIKKVEQFIKNLKKEITKQVLIEAKIVEVRLSDQMQYGIDWSALLSRIGSTTITASQTLALGGSYGQIIATNLNFRSVINALADVGKIETLSNPRIRVLNGQSALISSGTITPFWEKQVQTITGTNTTQTASYVRTSVLDGILLGVSPYINDDGTITLNIVPVSTSIRGTKQLIIGSQVQAEAPILDIKEAGTTIKVKDGSLVIIGGLISKTKQKEEKKIPLLGDIPVLGNLFKSQKVKDEKKELIIFLKPKIINPNTE